VHSVHTSLERLQTLILDSIERLAILETSHKFGDLQRHALIDSTEKLSSRLTEVSSALHGYGELNERVKAISARLDAHDVVFAEARGGIRATKIFWSAIWAAVGMMVAGTIAYLKQHG